MGMWESLTLLSWVAIGFLSLAMFGLSRQIAQLISQVGPQRVQRHVRLPRLPDGVHRSTAATDLSVVLYVDERCPSCERLLSDISKGRVAIRDGIDVAVVVERQSADRVALPAGTRLLITDESLSALGVAATPFAALVRNGEVIDGTPVGSAVAFRGFLTQVEGNVQTPPEARPMEVTR